MNSTKTFLVSYRTPLAAAAATILLGSLVLLGRMDVNRAAGIVVFCWCLAAHSLDNNSHKAEIVEGLQKVEAAGIALRVGDKTSCADELQAAARIGAAMALERTGAESKATGA